LNFDKSGSSSFGRAIAFQAIGGQFEPGLPLQLLDENGRCGSVVEHFLGKEEVVSSILINGSKGLVEKKKAMVDGLGGLLTAIIKKTKTNKDV
jgi:hypothetical protein